MDAHQILAKTIKRIEGAYAPSTIRAYKANFERFIEFCKTMGANALPANARIIATYIAHLSKNEMKSASIRIAIAAISCIHKLNQLKDTTQHPDVVIEMKRMHRTLGRSSKQAFGITAPILKNMISTTNKSIRDLRDKALILLAYDSLCRRSELAGLIIEDIEFDSCNFPISIRIRKSKSDQEAIGKIIRITPESQRAIKDWIRAAKISQGFLFRGVKNNGDLTQGINPAQINRIYKKLAKNIGLSDLEIRNISGHSFRVGRTQDLINAGSTLAEIMTRGRWSKTDTAIRYGEFTRI